MTTAAPEQARVDRVRRERPTDGGVVSASRSLPPPAKPLVGGVLCESCPPHSHRDCRVVGWCWAAELVAIRRERSEKRGDA